MTVKRIIVVLLVALMSVAGASAQNNVIRYTATSKISDSDWQRVGGTIARIVTHTFDPASKLGVVTYNNDITAIGMDIFNTKPLISIDLPSSVSSISTHAFSYCNSLASLDIPACVTYFDREVIRSSSALKTIIINSQQTLNAAGYYHRIDDNEQRGNGYVTTTFENQVEKYILKGNITNIPNFKFYDCSMTSITLPENLISIGVSAFRSCSLQFVTIPRTVTFIDAYAFEDCPLQSITVLATTPPSLDYDVFAGVNKSIPIYVPEGTADAYRAASGWSEFTNFIEITHHKLFLVSSNTSLGKVCGAGRYNTTTEVTIYAAPKAGCKFTGWSDGNTENPRQYVVMSDATLTANFEAENVFEDPTGAGMRMKVTKTDNKVYEFKTQDVKNVNFIEQMSKIITSLLVAKCNTH